ncbi:hypothetical protein D1007_42103 [Hordeum vulgare]|nr:hypothetical protein D1007_42103 [Hordeum vulgare]
MEERYDDDDEVEELDEEKFEDAREANIGRRRGNYTEDSEKWKLRDKEDPPKKGSLVNLEDNEDSEDAPNGGRNKGKPDGNRKEKERGKRPADAISLWEQIGDTMKVK